MEKKERKKVPNPIIPDHLKRVIEEMMPKWKKQEKSKLPIQCPNYSTCKRHCKTRVGIIYHFVRCSWDRYPYKCEKCSAKYSTQRAFARHVACGCKETSDQVGICDGKVSENDDGKVSENDDGKVSENDDGMGHENDDGMGHDNDDGIEGTVGDEMESETEAVDVERPPEVNFDRVSSDKEGDATFRKDDAILEKKAPVAKTYSLRAATSSWSPSDVSSQLPIKRTQSDSTDHLPSDSKWVPKRASNLSRKSTRIIKTSHTRDSSACKASVPDATAELEHVLATVERVKPIWRECSQYGSKMKCPNFEATIKSNPVSLGHKAEDMALQAWPTPMATPSPVNATPPPVNTTPPPVDTTPPPVDAMPPPVDTTPPPVDTTPPLMDATLKQWLPPPKPLGVSNSKPQATPPSLKYPPPTEPKAALQNPFQNQISIRVLKGVMCNFGTDKPLVSTGEILKQFLNIKIPAVPQRRGSHLASYHQLRQPLATHLLVTPTRQRVTIPHSISSLDFIPASKEIVSLDHLYTSANLDRSLSNPLKEEGSAQQETLQKATEGISLDAKSGLSQNDIITCETMESPFEVEVIAAEDYDSFKSLARASDDSGISIVDDDHEESDSLSELTTIQANTYCHLEGQVDLLTFSTNLRKALFGKEDLSNVSHSCFRDSERPSISGHRHLIQVDGSANVKSGHRDVDVLREENTGNSSKVEDCETEVGDCETEVEDCEIEDDDFQRLRAEMMGKNLSVYFGASPAIEMIDEDQLDGSGRRKKQQKSNSKDKSEDKSVTGQSAEVPVTTQESSASLTDVPDEVPEVAGEVPDVPGEVPEVAGEVPDVPHKVPEVAGEVPDVPDEVPEVAGEVPDVPDEVPEVAGEVPDVPGEVPEVAGEVPGVPGEVPEVAGEVPDVPGEVPEVAGEVPEVAGEVSEVAGEVPEVAGEVPEVAGEVPEVAMELSEAGQPAERIDNIPGGIEAVIESLMAKQQEMVGQEPVTCDDTQKLKELINNPLMVQSSVDVQTESPLVDPYSFEPEEMGQPSSSVVKGKGKGKRKPRKQATPTPKRKKKEAVREEKKMEGLAQEDSPARRPKSKFETPTSDLPSDPEELYTMVNQNLTTPEVRRIYRRIAKKHSMLKCVNEGCTFQSAHFQGILYHYERCCREALEFKCSVCGNVYSTKNGLKYHMDRHKEKEHVPSEDSEEKKKRKRKSAKIASQNLSQLEAVSEEPSSSEPPSSERPDTPEESPHKPLKKLPAQSDTGELDHLLTQLQETVDIELKKKRMYTKIVHRQNSVPRTLLPSSKDPVSPSQVIPDMTNQQVMEARQLLAVGKKVNCPNKECEAMLGSIAALKYHVPRCLTSSFKNKLPAIKCHICKKSLGKKPGALVAHIKSTHPEVAAEVDFDEEYAPIEGEQELESKWKANSLKNYRSWYDRHWSDGKFSDDQWMPLVSEWTVTDKRPRYNSSFAGVHFESFEKDLNSLPLHESFLVNQKDVTVPTIFMNGGGCVTALSWLPLPPSLNQEMQVLAISIYPAGEEFPVEKKSKGEGVVQLWTIGGGGADTKLGMAVLHDFGYIRKMKWCPTGAYTEAEDTESPMDTDQDTTDKVLSRYGLLAMACSDGSVKVLSIPNIKELKESFGVEDPSLPLWVKPEGVSACLLPGGGDLLAVDDVFGSCLCFDWCAADRHEKIIAGFSSGNVVVWYLSSDSPLLVDHKIKGARLTMYPIIHITSSNKPCLSVAWCPNDPTYVLTAGHDCKLRLWNIYQTGSPLGSILPNERSGIIKDLIWPPLLNGVVVLDEPVLKTPHSLRCLMYNDQLSFNSWKKKTQCTTASPMSCVSYSPWLQAVVVGTFSGCLATNSINATRKFKNGYTLMQFSCSPRKRSEEEEIEGSSSMEVEEEEKDLSYCAKIGTVKKMVSIDEVYDMGSVNPAAAFTDVNWSPNFSCRNWLAVGTKCGIVIFLQVL